MTTRNHPESRALTAEFASFVAGLRYEDLPEDAVRTAERCYLDTLGVAVAGTASEPGRIAAGMLDAAGSAGGDATVLGHGTTASATDAAFVNGIAAHALDFDDMTRFVGHPSPPLVPAALAVGELTDASGRDLLTAYVAGFEVASALGALLEPEHYRAGWHSTSTYGTFSATAAAAWLLDLDPTATRHALNVAASAPAGLQRNFGTYTKPMHAGQAARAGTTAALLAADGFTADATAVEGDGGFCDLYGGAGDADVESVPPLGEDWAISDHGVQVKKYPCCYRTHPAIAATSALVEEAGIEPEDVDRIHVTGSERGPQILTHDDPETGFEGKFSLPYTVACAVVRDAVDLDAFADAAIDDPRVQRVRDRVAFEVDPSVPYTSFETRVVVETADGDRYETTRQNPPGRGDAPISDAEVREKFTRCARRVVDETAAENARDGLDDLRRQDAAGVATLVRSLAG